MPFPRLIAAAIGLALPLAAGVAEAAPATPAAHHGRPAHVVTVAEQPASVHFVARHRHYRHHRHYTRHRSYRHG